MRLGRIRALRELYFAGGSFCNLCCAEYYVTRFAAASSPALLRFAQRRLVRNCRCARKKHFGWTQQNLVKAGGGINRIAREVELCCMGRPILLIIQARLPAEAKKLLSLTFVNNMLNLLNN